MQSEFGERLSQVEERLKKQQKVPASSAGSQPLDGLVSMAHFKVIIGSLQVSSAVSQETSIRSSAPHFDEGRRAISMLVCACESFLALKEL